MKLQKAYHLKDSQVLKSSTGKKKKKKEKKKRKRKHEILHLHVSNKEFNSDSFNTAGETGQQIKGPELILENCMVDQLLHAVL